MVQLLDNITIQARQGSVAAIIQVLNETLADSGIRARAVVAQGVLQLLCEADSPQKLDQVFLVDQLRNLLETIRPRYIRLVKVNTRLVNEQQLLWLDEIEDDPDSQLLWTAEFSLSRRNLGQWLGDILQGRKISTSGVVLADTSERERQKRRTWQAIVGAGGLGLFFCLSGWAIYGSLNNGRLWQTSADEPDQSPIGQDKLVNVADTSLGTTSESSSAHSSLANLPAANPSPVNPSPVNPSPVNPSPANGPSASERLSDANPASFNTSVPDPFAQAVRLAEAAVADGKLAQTTDEWLDLAARWQRASDLMGSIPTEDERYTIARDRTILYKQNSLDSLKQADLVR